MRKAWSFLVSEPLKMSSSWTLDPFPEPWFSQTVWVKSWMASARFGSLGFDCASQEALCEEWKGVVRRLVWNWKVREEVGLQNWRSVFWWWSEGWKWQGLLRHNNLEVLSLKVWVWIYCQVRENYRGNSRNSGYQVWTYKMSEGTSASAYVLHPFQTLVPRFQNEEDGVSEIGVLE